MKIPEVVLRTQTNYTLSQLSVYWLNISSFKNVYIYIYIHISAVKVNSNNALTQIPFKSTNFINARLTQCVFSIWPMAKPVVGEMEMHSVANLATLQTPLATFFPSQKCPNLIQSLINAGTAARAIGLAFPARAHASLSLSPRLLSLFSMHTHTSFFLSASAQFLFSAHTHLSLSASAQFVFSARQKRAELNSVKHWYYVACFSNFTCKYSQNHSTSIVIILWVFYLIRQQLDL